MLDQLVGFFRDLRSAARSLGRVPGLTLAVVLTLALGIGANAAMFSLLRGVLLAPLVNRDEGRLIYIRQSENGDNATFSVPEIKDIESRVKTMKSFGDFSVIGFTLVGLGEPRSVHAGVVGGSFFETMGLHPVLGRLLNEHDDGPAAAGAVVLTCRFWSTALNRDPSVIGKQVRLGSFIDSHTATVVGVLEPSVPYPQDTEIIANMVTSSHHLSATMNTDREHRMTDLFARLAPGVELPAARAELDSVYAAIKKQHPEAYPSRGDYRISAMLLRDELTSGARTMLLVLMAASVLVFVIACSNVANLILARTVRRENELATRAALGARSLDLRRLLLSESLLLCLAGAGIAMLIARPLVSVLARYASRYSVRALDLTIDSSMLWVGAGLAVLAAVLLAFIPRLPSARAPQGYAMAAAAGSRMSGTANRKLKIFALVQIAACFVLVTAAAATVSTLLSLQSARTGFDTRHVMVVNLPVMRQGRTPTEVVDYYRKVMQQVLVLPGVINTSLVSSAPWRDSGFRLSFSVDGHKPAANEEQPQAEHSVVSPGLFATLGLPVLAGRDFNDSDRAGKELVAIVSQTLAQRMFPNGDALGHYVQWSDPRLRFAPGGIPAPRRIVGVVPDIDNRHFAPRPTMTIYHPFDQDPLFIGDHLLVYTSSDPYPLVQPITRVVHQLSADQPVEHANTLEDIRAEVLSPERLNVLISSVFAGVALLIAVVGVAGVLAFSVSGRTREFGIRLAVGAVPRNLLMGVIAQGAAMAVGGLVVGLAGGFWLGRLAGSFIGELKMPGVLPVSGAALVLLLGAMIASAIPALRAARIDVIEALRTE
ncbi:MAG TPA: ADOP family duplicated permease [Candidatus Angelobacter sp.]|nr:ADOP family duplicated permease [Candidatus Angelobacter sp.]